MEFVVTKIQENQANLYKAYLQLDKIKNIIQESGLFHNDSYPTPDQVVAYNITYQPELSDEGIDANKTNGSITNNIVEQTNIFFRFGDTAYINLIKSSNLKEDTSNLTLQIAFLSQEGDHTHENLLMYIDFELLDHSKEVTDKTTLSLPIDEFEDLSSESEGDVTTNG
ncbi:hypothetical protein P9232_06995 [Weizmannia sp. CD-2023]|uniref:hypothetical protein n=1 Tax=Heyndrickxia TaxID=2837504 RepID=UPI0005566F89|nr:MULTISPECIES: hypothetical protein [Heyndrickxia]KGT37203.1 hypothetical protein P421_16730 [Heyndrickxia coagulans P38]MBF8416814.1 hypothetical protein [Heyndrickxia coagulans]MED4321181.1 hypothetical protein [Weizmannia sp. CD-2023]QWU06599.1 hypothetical protein KNH48_14590 [Heyndrickxia coagulans]